MKTTILFLSISIACGLLFVNLYSSLVDARSWGSDIPNSIAAARAYFKTTNPGNFFRIFSPLNQLLGLVVLVLFWRSGLAVRYLLGTALLMYFAAEGLTFGFFYPRNEIMFHSAQLSEVSLLKKTWMEWTAMNWIRTAVLLVGITCSYLALHKLYTGGNKG